VPLESYSFDFSYHLPRTDHTFWVVDTDVGKVLKVHRVTGATDLWCSGLGKATSCREVEGVLYVADNAGGKIWAVSTTQRETKSVHANLPGVFWIDYRSDGRLIVATHGLHTFIVEKNGTMAEVWTGAGGKIPFITLSVDRNGTFGEKDAWVCTSTQGGGNIDLWRFSAAGKMWPRDNYSSLVNGYGPMSVGILNRVQDGVGHYPWVAEHHPDDGVLMVQGMSNPYPQLIQRLLPGDPWVGGAFVPLENILNDGAAVLGMWGTQPVWLPYRPPGVPHWAAQINMNGGGQLWDSDHIGEMEVADALAFLKAGGIGSYPRTMPNNLWKAVLLYLYRNSQRYLKEGQPLIDRVLAFCKTELGV
jgi:hypothetical protein